MKIKYIRGGTIFYDGSGNSYVKLRECVEVLVPHCCDGATKSKVNCLLLCEGILMWLDPEKWVDTKDECTR